MTPPLIVSLKILRKLLLGNENAEEEKATNTSSKYNIIKKAGSTGSTFFYAHLKCYHSFVRLPLPNTL
jgi:hypothetical protein